MYLSVTVLCFAKISSSALLSTRKIVSVIEFSLKIENFAGTMGWQTMHNT